jgi:hypothetical protein
MPHDNKRNHEKIRQTPLDDLPDDLIRGSLLLVRIAHGGQTGVRPGSYLSACARALENAGHVRIRKYRGSHLLHVVSRWRAA